MRKRRRTCKGLKELVNVMTVRKLSQGCIHWLLGTNGLLQLPLQAVRQTDKQLTVCHHKLPQSHLRVSLGNGPLSRFKSLFIQVS